MVRRPGKPAVNVYSLVLLKNRRVYLFLLNNTVMMFRLLFEKQWPLNAKSMSTTKSSHLMNVLTDSFGRKHNYLRVSLTERCNLRCEYCMPADGIKLSNRDNLLTTEETVRLVGIFVKNGVDKVRITGGEPTVRKDIVHIVESLKCFKSLRTIAMTTNGLTLTKTLVHLQRAGLNALNVSMDTLQPAKYEKITRRDGRLLKRVLAGIDLALQLGFSPVKVNCVLMRDFNANELCDFVEATRHRDVHFRFIEFMPFSKNDWDERQLVPYKEAIREISKSYPNFGPCDHDDPNSTSKMYRVPDFAGKVGFISSMTSDYCDSCNRLRLMADGNLKSCLFQNDEINLRDPLRRGAPEEELLNIISDAVKAKKRKHAANGLSSVNTRTTRTNNKIRSLLSRPDDPGWNTVIIRRCHELTHVDPESGKARMVDVTGKPATRRTATATALVKLNRTAVELIQENTMKKGDVLAVAQLAGICAAKKTWDLIPLCHQVRLDGVSVVVRLDREESAVTVTATAVTEDRTGVEMEALTACTVAALTVYDMCKAVSKHTVIESVRLVSKTKECSKTS
ncbi:molybdenum cofactor biosynthesis protein 1 isoform X2 [Adelges cooleyi]|uniref:molybdenum cofactor biosynthesis protein 1 isoform X2 n=1 Tax=Adelges cooleyi TaxID=133065 RepID=UPI00217FAC4E|nr:molybdenum cofactor biosynthesis protein 1 isoform X2 [Adelges cooleyi]